MSLKKAQMISIHELSLSRLTTAVTRRVGNLPHTLAWRLANAENSNNVRLITRLRDAYHGERCFILGNGPSLAKTDLNLLRNEKTFGLNRIYLLLPSVEYRPTFYVCMNDWVISQSIAEIEKVEAIKFINWRYRRHFQDLSKTIFLHETFAPRFTIDLRQQIWGGATVTYAAMQIAYHLGFQQVILIGVDHRFNSKGTPHQVVTAGEEDPDHFHPKYFADGTRWQLPDLRSSEYAYQLARDTFEADGRQILDATLDGALQVFPKVDYGTLFSDIEPVVGK